MIVCLSTNVISPLGNTTLENYEAVKAGKTALRPHPNGHLSLFSEEQTRQMAKPGLTRFESLAVASAADAVSRALRVETAGRGGGGGPAGEPLEAVLGGAGPAGEPLEAVFGGGGPAGEPLEAVFGGAGPAGEPLEAVFGGARTVFVLSTTKANIEGGKAEEAASAERIARFLGITTPPVVVCNACISGVAAIILAMQLLESRAFDYAVVCGADVQSEFTISGFQSLNALDPGPCRPFDIERLGLNLGEAAATMVLCRQDTNDGLWTIQRGCVCNDAYHITSPSKNGEGATRALDSILEGTTALGGSPAETGNTTALGGSPAETGNAAFVNAHGTGTMFNDQMESVAIERAGLNGIPVNSLKGYFGHTLGAAGVLETVISMAAADDGTVLETRGFEERGVSGKISVTTRNESCHGHSFIKMISGFGGGNAAILVTKSSNNHTPIIHCKEYRFSGHTIITPDTVTLDGVPVECNERGMAMITELYKRFVGDYPKYYKMDPLSRLGLVAAQMAVTACGNDAVDSVVLFSNSSCVMADRRFLQSIASPDNYFPSPAAFVYTLPNIVTGEIAIRHNIHGGTSFYILTRKDEDMMKKIIASTPGNRVIAGWLDYFDEHHFLADLSIRTL